MLSAAAGSRGRTWMGADQTLSEDAFLPSPWRLHPEVVWAGGTAG